MIKAGACRMMKVMRALMSRSAMSGWSVIYLSTALAMAGKVVVASIKYFI